MELSHRFAEYGVCRTVRVCVWSWRDTVMKGVSESVACCCKSVMISDRLQSEMMLLSETPASFVLVVEIHTVRLTEIIDESVGVCRLYQLVSMGGHKRFHQSGRPCFVKGDGKAVEASVIVLEVTEHNLVARGQA